MPRPAAMDLKSEKSLSTDDISLLGASLGGPEEPVMKRELNSIGIDEIDDIDVYGSCVESILK